MQEMFNTTLQGSKVHGNVSIADSMKGMFKYHEQMQKAVNAAAESKEAIRRQA